MKRETVEEFLLRGGLVEKLEPAAARGATPNRGLIRVGPGSNTRIAVIHRDDGSVTTLRKAVGTRNYAEELAVALCDLKRKRGGPWLH